MIKGFRLGTVELILNGMLMAPLMGGVTFERGLGDKPGFWKTHRLKFSLLPVDLERLVQSQTEWVTFDELSELSLSRNQSLDTVLDSITRLSVIMPPDPLGVVEVRDFIGRLKLAEYEENWEISGSVGYSMTFDVEFEAARYNRPTPNFPKHIEASNPYLEMFL